MNETTEKLSRLRWIGILFRILALCCVALAAIDAWLSTDLYLSARRLLADGASSNPGLWTDVEQKEALVARLEIPTLIIGLGAMFTWLGWLYGSVRRLRMAQLTGLEHSPWMTVIWHFVPVMQLWKPMHAYLELANASTGNSDWKTLPPPHLAVWTALLLAITGLSNAAYRKLLDRADEISDVVNLVGFRIFIDTLTVATLGAMIIFTLKIYRNLSDLAGNSNGTAPKALPESQIPSI